MNLKDLNETPHWKGPEDAATLALKALGDRETTGKDCLLTAELAGELVILNEAIADALLTKIQSNEEAADLRPSAAIALDPGIEEAEPGCYDDPNDEPSFSEPFLKRIQGTFHKLYFDSCEDTNVRQAVLESSVRNPREWHSAAIQEAHAKDNMTRQPTAVFYMMRFIKGFVMEILQALNSVDPRIHYNAIEAANNWQLDAAWTHVA